VGHCRKTVREAMLVSAEEYGYLVRGYNEDIQERYNVARWMCFKRMLTSPFIKQKPGSPEQYAPFPWDKPREVRPSRVTPEEEAELNRLKEDFLKHRNE